MQRALCVAVCLLAAAGVVGGQSITAVRLVGGLTPNEGVLEVQVGRTWSRVCDSGFDNNGTAAACAMLGYRPPRGYKISYSPVVTGRPTTTVAITGCPNFLSSSESTWTLDRSCNIVFDSVGTPLPSDCNAPTRDVAIICTTTLITTTVTPGPTVTPNLATLAPTNCSNVTDLRLSPGPNEGLVLIKNISGDNFGTICAAGFSASEASVICSMLCRGAVNAIGETGKYLAESARYSVMLSGLTCPVNSTHTNECRHNGWGVAATPCTDRTAVSVRCSEIDPSPPAIPTARANCFDYAAHVYFTVDEVASASLLTLVGGFNSSVCNFTTGQNATTVWAQIPYLGCNSALTSNDTHITYTANVYKNVTPSGSVYLDSSYVYPVSCSIAKPNEATARMQPDARTAPPVSGTDTYAAEVKLFRAYSGRAFSAEIAAGERLTVGSRVYARVALTSPLDVRLTATNCWAQPDTGGSARMPILENKCPAANVNLFRVDLKTIGLNFVVMRFTDPGLTQVYIYCDVSICDASDTSARCAQVCGTPVRRRRRSATLEEPEAESRSYDGPFELTELLAASGANRPLPPAPAAALALVAVATAAQLLRQQLGR